MNKEQLLLYAVTDRAWVGKYTLLEQIEQALEGGVSILQLREKNLSEEQFIKEASEVKRLCSKYGVPLIINDSFETALKSGADGVHVGIEDMPVDKIRKAAGKDFIIGATAKTVAQAQKAEADGADYLGVGAVFPSPTKKNALRITAGQLKEITSCVSIPSVAIGGITPLNAELLKGGGICGIAVVSALFGAEDISRACLELRRAALSVID
ncbi:MAG: thiamine phosphate synthase [Christensenellaceae bacterium]|jgi:thiamine-phosphate diphosphorylase|nr:thiamine phosphate synthase [Christensenellaceae bacterium]PWM01382.1 MAG: thiamine phosphate synthase [Selenomonadales bacterium]